MTAFIERHSQGSPSNSQQAHEAFGGVGQFGRPRLAEWMRSSHDGFRLFSNRILRLNHRKAVNRAECISLLPPFCVRGVRQVAVEARVGLPLSNSPIPIWEGCFKNGHGNEPAATKEKRRSNDG